MPNVKFKNGYSQDLPSSIENGNLYALSDVNKLVIDVNDSRISLSDGEGKQDLLLSGVNIKTINDQSILGSGNLTVATSHTVWNVQTTTTWQFNSTTQLYYQDVAVSGSQGTITELDSPWVDVILPTSKVDIISTISYWSEIIKIESYDGYIRLYSKSNLQNVLQLIVKR